LLTEETITFVKLVFVKLSIICNVFESEDTYILFPEVINVRTVPMRL